MRKYAIPSASRIDALSGSRFFAFSSATVACAAMPFARCCRPCWNRSYVSLISFAPRRRRSPQIREVLLHQVKRVRQVSRSPDLDTQNALTGIDPSLQDVGQFERRPGQSFEERHERGSDHPERRAREWIRRVVVEHALDEAVANPHRV